jgi:hypothetical protein
MTSSFPVQLIVICWVGASLWWTAMVAPKRLIANATAFFVNARPEAAVHDISMGIERDPFSVRS